MPNSISVTRGSRQLLDRLLDTPQLAAVVPRLQPEVLHRVLARCGLEDCGELLTLATPEQLRGVLDLDLWRAEQPGQDEQFDAARFGLWLETLMQSGADVAARVVARMDADLVAAALAQYARVFDVATVSGVRWDGEIEFEVRVDGDEGLQCEVGGYVIVGTQAQSQWWDAIVGVLMALEGDHNEYFHRVMVGCRDQSDSTPEEDGFHDLLTDRDQAAVDLDFMRERRREQQGYISPAQARAFLQASRELQLGRDSSPPANPVARAYFRTLATDAAEAAAARAASATAASAAAGESDVSVVADAADAAPAPKVAPDADAVAAVVDVLLEAGVLPQPPRALLEAAAEKPSRVARIQRQMQAVCDSDPLAWATRSQEIAYLANAIMAGCSIQARPWTTQEASDATVAICNLGLENWPPHWPEVADDFLVHHDLVSVFQVGWNVLHHRVCLHATESLIATLADLRCADPDTHAAVQTLRMLLTRHWRSGQPWRARDDFDVLAILDLPAWAALLGLIDELPVMHATIAASRDTDAHAHTHAVKADAFEFIAENGQIEDIHDFLRALPNMLRA